MPDPKELKQIYLKLNKLIRAYSPPLKPWKSSADKIQYHLSSKKEVVIAGRKKDEVYFAGAIIQKGYVGFYYMPAYAKPELKKFFSPELLKLLKGKSCFHLKELTPSLERDIKNALKLGFAAYKKRGWV